MEPETLLRLPEVERRTGLRRAHLYKLARAGTFPRPLKIGARASPCGRARRAHPKLQVAFDIGGVPLIPSATPEIQRPVSVVLAVRHGEHILSGELYIRRERFDIALFLQAMDPVPDRAS